MLDEKKTAILPTQYDLKRNEVELINKKSITASFRPMDTTQIDASGHFSGIRKVRGQKRPLTNFLGELDRIKSLTPESLRAKTEFIPDLRITFIENAVKLKEAIPTIVEKLIEANERVSKNYFVLPELIVLAKKDTEIHQQLMLHFVEKVRARYPRAKIGFECTARVYEHLPEARKKFSFVCLNSSVKKRTGITMLKNAIEHANADGVSALCVNANIFVENSLFAPTLITEPIIGFSYYHGDRPHKSGKFYYNPSEETTLVTPKGKTTRVRYWTEEQMLGRYGPQKRLSELCPCLVCASQTIESWFAHEKDVLSQINLRHRSSFVNFKATEIETEWIMARLQLEVSAPFEAPLSNSAESASGAPIPHTIPSAIDSMEGKIKYVVGSAENGTATATEIANKLRMNGTQLTRQSFLSAIESLLRGRQINYSIRGEDGFIYFRP